MNCEAIQEMMVDAACGEDLSIRDSFQVFRHLESCQTCESEFHELLVTREQLQGWVIDEVDLPPFEPVDGRSWGRKTLRWVASTGPWFQKVAAAVLILVGAYTVLQTAGFLGGQTVTVNQQQLMEMVNDMIVIRQAEERKIIGQALVNFADEMAVRQRMNSESVDAELKALEYRYLENIEETNSYLRTLLSR